MSRHLLLCYVLYHLVNILLTFSAVHNDIKQGLILLWQCFTAFKNTSLTQRILLLCITKCIMCSLFKLEHVISYRNSEYPSEIQGLKAAPAYTNILEIQTIINRWYCAIYWCRLTPLKNSTTCYKLQCSKGFQQPVTSLWIWKKKEKEKHVQCNVCFCLTESLQRQLRSTAKVILEPDSSAMKTLLCLNHLCTKEQVPDGF